jgi:predicted TIM-barrel fold metal-dependent hydrolase
MLPVIDTHQHLWNLKQLRLSWIDPNDKTNPLAQNFTPVEYAQATAGLEVVKSIYMEVDVVPEDKTREADYVVELCRGGKTTMVAAVIGGRPAEPGFQEYLKPYLGGSYVKGVRQVLPAGFVVTPEFTRNLQFLGEQGLSWDLCVPPTELPAMVKLVQACPKTRFILDHCGNPSVKFTPEQRAAWRASLQQLAALPNVVACKLSGFIVNAGPGPWSAEDLAPYIQDTIQAFGVTRCVFGGDWPVVLRASTYKDWLTMLRQILAARPEAEQRAILHDNAQRIYQLPA